MDRLSRIIFGLCSVALVSAMATAQAIKNTPTPAWIQGDNGYFETADPTRAGLSVDALTRATAIAAEAGSDSLLVVHNDKIVLEKYWNDKTRADVQQMYSATKSPFAFVVGRALANGYFKSLDQPIVELVPEIAGDGREVLTFRNIMAMESGLEQERALDERDARAELGQFEIVLRRKVTREPYARYDYNNAGYRLLFTALERASGKTIPQLTREELFEPLGMMGAYWVELRTPEALKGYQSIRMRPIDLAKIGQIMLNRGLWRGERYLPEAYVEAMVTAPAPDANPSYGLFWHLNGGSHLLSYYESDRIDGMILPGTPSDAIANYGSRGQVLVAVPSLDLVWIRTGPNIPGTIWENKSFIPKLSAAIVAAVD